MFETVMPEAAAETTRQGPGTHSALPPEALRPEQGMAAAGGVEAARLQLVTPAAPTAEVVPLRAAPEAAVPRVASPVALDAARRFRALHAGPALLILANAADAGSARLIESLGATAIATSSAGVAWTHGLPDNDSLPQELYLSTLTSIVARVSIPVSADIEGGYSDDPAAVGELVRRVIGTGVVGINIEDGVGPAASLAAKISAARAAAEAEGVPLFINARSDVWLRDLAPDRAFDEFLGRVARYRDAGADGLFAPGLTDGSTIGAAVAWTGGLPLNVMARPGLPDANELRRLGVRRLSIGSAMSEAVYGLMSRLAGDFLAGRSERLQGGGMDYAAINALMG